MTKIQIQADMESFCKLAGVTKANWSQKAATGMLMALTRKILKASGYSMPDKVRAELMECWEFKGLACNASQLRQHLFTIKYEEKAIADDLYAKDIE